MTGSIAEAMQITLTPHEKTKLAHAPTLNLNAYDIYLRARELHNRMEFHNFTLKMALDLYKQAIEFDPGFADAHAGMADAALVVWDNSLGRIMPPAKARPLAKSAMKRALAVDPDNLLAHLLNARLLSLDKQHDEAIKLSRELADQHPTSALAYQGLAWSLSVAGQSEGALVALEKALRIDPKPSAYSRNRMGFIYFNAGKYERAENIFYELVTKKASGGNSNNYGLAMAAAKLKNMDVARQAVLNILALHPQANLRKEAFTNWYVDPKVLENTLEALESAGLPEWPYGFKGDEENRLSADETMELLRGRLVKGRMKTSGAFEFRVDEDGLWEFYLLDHGGKGNGKFFIENGQFYSTFAGGGEGRVHTPVFYRNPGGLRKNLDEYIIVDMHETYKFSVVE